MAFLDNTGYDAQTLSALLPPVLITRFKTGNQMQLATGEAELTISSVSF